MRQILILAAKANMHNLPLWHTIIYLPPENAPQNLFRNEFLTKMNRSANHSGLEASLDSEKRQTTHEALDPRA